MSISERIVSGKCQPAVDFLPKVEVRTFASAECGAKGMTTASVTFAPAGKVPYHTHAFSDAITVVNGEALVSVEGRSYLLRALDCIHVPSGVAHEVANGSDRIPLIAHCALASSVPNREPVNREFVTRTCLDPNAGSFDPEFILRFQAADSYQLSVGAEFRDLFSGRYGSVGICGGYAKFQPGSSLPCHTHDYDESISIVEGEAICEVAGRRYVLSDFDTAFVPQGRPHRFLNESRQPMAMIWVYAGSEPSRSIIDSRCCTELTADYPEG